MENIEKKTPLNDLMDTTMDKIRDMVDSNTIIGEPIQTPDGVTVIPVSRVSFGFGAGGGFGRHGAVHAPCFCHQGVHAQAWEQGCCPTLQRRCFQACHSRGWPIKRAATPCCA